MKYLLSTGRATTKIEEYVADLVRLYLQIYPNDVPGNSGIGFDFTITNTMKSDLPQEVQRKVEDLVSRIKARFKNGVTLEVASVEIIDETKAKIELNLGSDEEVEIIEIAL